MDKEFQPLMQDYLALNVPGNLPCLRFTAGGALDPNGLRREERSGMHRESGQLGPAAWRLRRRFGEHSGYFA